MIHDTCISVDNENFDSIPGCLCHGLNVFLNAKQDLYEMLTFNLFFFGQFSPWFGKILPYWHIMIIKIPLLNTEENELLKIMVAHENNHDVCLFNIY